MTQIYEGAGITKYLLESGKTIILTKEEFEELTKESIEYTELVMSLEELEKINTILEKSLVENEIRQSAVDELKCDLHQYEEDDVIQLVKKLRCVDNTDSEDFLGHIERTAKAILGGGKQCF